MITFIRKYTEAIIWTTALVGLFLMHPHDDQPSLCMFRFLGFKSCWGCGIGHSIYYALHLQFRESVQAHILGIPATLIIIWQIVKNLTTKQYNYGSTEIVHDVS